ncbi:recombinase family protein [Chloroflexota bacterium]
MKRAAIYCRVSTDSQEREGTSLQTQLEHCLTYCQSKGYDVSYRFSEAYSGLSLERPELDKLRELVRTEAIDVVVCFSLDRLTRDPGHGVILTQELEKHHVILEAVTEDIDNSELGKLISYIRGFASKLEAAKIKERTTRGKKAKAKMGKMCSGGASRLFGYNYVKMANSDGGRRVVNEDEAMWVKNMYHWFVDDKISTHAVAYRLRELHVPTKHNKLWRGVTVANILKNPAYTGKTYAFTSIKGVAFAKNREDWIEIPNATPPIISEELFKLAQKQLGLNKKHARRNLKRQYLLRGHIHCKKCGRTFYGGVVRTSCKGERVNLRQYKCAGKIKMIVPIDRCSNKRWLADKLEPLVWGQIQHILDNPELITTEIERQCHDANQLDLLETELKQIEYHLNALDREQRQLLQWALKGFPEDQVVAENKRINQRRTTLQSQKTEKEAQIKASKDAATSMPKLEHFVELIREKLTTLDFETKRLVLDMLNINVLLDGNDVEITGTIPIMEDVIVNRWS